MSSLIVSLLLSGCLAAPGEPVVRFEQQGSSLQIQVEGKPFATYVWNDPVIRRPYFAHLRSPGGVPITRTLPPVEGQDPTDHATMHPGLWLAFGEIAGVDFWRNQGLVRHAEFVEPPTSSDRGGSFTVRNVYEANGRTICEETCRIEIRPSPRGTILEWDSRFKGPEEFAFGDQEEMGLGIRMATGLTVKHGGTITNSEGRTNEANVWGRQADWCAYAGPGAGIVLMPSPQNFRRSWFHARDYGLLVANPFGRRAFTQGEPSRVVVRPGESLDLRFTLLIHDGQADPDATYRDLISAKPAIRPNP